MDRFPSQSTMESSIAPKEKEVFQIEDAAQKRATFKRQGTSFDVVLLPASQEKSKGALFDESGVYTNGNVEPDDGKYR